MGEDTVVFFDELTTGLDTAGRAGAWAMIRELLAQRSPVLLTTEYLEEADRLERTCRHSAAEGGNKGRIRPLRAAHTRNNVERKHPSVGHVLVVVLIIPPTFVSNAFVPVETMPDWMQTFASWNPVGHLAAAVRGLMMGGPLAVPLAVTLAWMALFVIAFAPVSLIAHNHNTTGTQDRFNGDEQSSPP